ncbi:hypothetical protein ACTOWA_00020 [Herbaspirillum seropedicae]|uniref:hypothetical protein n=1 Tax=Herbaspirillum seropedicae TaxID=964 RepID=UPI002866DA90|nr:hypothetical protein [Herbaspirillum seropedicae]MDR6398027.1 hypothetical protein [Herbaspirillum seropedicae]
MYGCTVRADAYHASFEPQDDIDSALAKTLLKDYREDADGSLHWCTFDGIVKGHSSVGGVQPHRYQNFHAAGYFSREDGMQRLLDMKVFWDAYEGSLKDGRMENELRQPSESEVEVDVRLTRNSMNNLPSEVLARFREGNETNKVNEKRRVLKP